MSELKGTSKYDPYKVGMQFLSLDDYWTGKTIEFLLNPTKEGAMKLRDVKVMQVLGGYTVMLRVQDTEGYKIGFQRVDRIADVPTVIRNVLEGKVQLKPDKYAPSEE